MSVEVHCDELVIPMSVVCGFPHSDQAGFASGSFFKMPSHDFKHARRHTCVHTTN